MHLLEWCYNDIELIQKISKIDKLPNDQVKIAEGAKPKWAWPDTGPCEY